jgi:hypothetical protein
VSLSSLSTAAAADEAVAQPFDVVRLSAEVRSCLLRAKYNLPDSGLVQGLSEAFALLTVGALPFRAACLERIDGMLNEVRIALRIAEAAGPEEKADCVNAASCASGGGGGGSSGVGPSVG